MKIPFILSDEFSDFPNPELALDKPNGLLAIGGDLSANTLLNAYKKGIFPWPYGDEYPLMWYSPDPRMILYPENFHCSKSLQKLLRNNVFSCTINNDFETIIRQCATIRKTEGTWISEQMIEAYLHLHHLGYADSVECWFDGQLVGGLYGVRIESAFFGESMFSKMSNASKFAFAHLVKYCLRQKIQIIDCQVESSHLKSLGAENISRSAFINLLNKIYE